VRGLEELCKVRELLKMTRRIITIVALN